MPARSRVRKLPPDIRSELNVRLIEGGFSDYGGLEAWLADRGHRIGKSAVHRYGQQLEKRIEQIRLSQEHAAALVDAVGDEHSGSLGRAAMSLVERHVFETILASEEGEVDLTALAKIAKALADTARAGVTVQAERRRARAEAAEDVSAVVERAGLSPDVAAQIRAAVEGV